MEGGTDIAHPQPGSPANTLVGSADDWLARDYDVNTLVYVLAQPRSAYLPGPSGRTFWSICWPVGGQTEAEMTAWRHIRLELTSQLVDVDGRCMRYTYRGPITKTFDPEMRAAKRYSLGAMPLAIRKKIEQLAAGIRVVVPNAGGDKNASRVWMQELLMRIALLVSGGMTRSALDRIVQLIEPAQ
ncbi:hypothetical protein BD413DRAFT_177529 [Trametes elegans]|nr:hypothetical protein BD413DRAFT_177529 [Trametes elegans]